MKTEILFAHKYEDARRGSRWTHVTRHPKTTGLYDSKQPVHKVRVTENPAGDYWAWWSNRERTFHFTSCAKGGVTICFPYPIKAHEDRGEGLLLQVTVEEHVEDARDEQKEGQS